MALSQNLTTISSWLEEKLKEYFVRRSQFAKSSWNVFLDKLDFPSIILATQYKGVSIQTYASEFRILDFKLESGKAHGRKLCYTALSEENNNQSDCHNFANDNSTCSNDIEDCYSTKSNDGTGYPYQTRDSHVSIVYQESAQSAGKELLLCIQASQILDVQGMEEITPKFELSLDEHQIDVFTKLFPLLKYWMAFKNIKENLPVPECYYGSYETEVEKVDDVPSADDLSSKMGDLFEDQDFNGDFRFDGDFLSKVAAGLETLEREKRKKEANAWGTTNKQSSYRLLVLQDIERQNFRQRNVGHSSTFLCLLNVEEALKSLAMVHSVSWAYGEISGDTLLKKCPFLNHPLYLPYVTERVVQGFSVMERLVLEYLVCSSRETKEDGENIRKSLGKLSYHLKEILQGAKHPRHVKCLIHQSTNFSSFLFRYSVLKKPGENFSKYQEKGKVERAGGNIHCGTDTREERDNNRDNVKGKRPSSSNSCFNGPITTAERNRLDKILQREVMIINWRTACVGSPMIDVAFLLLTSLPPETRRAETTSLLRIYWNTFRDIAKKFGLSLTWTDKELYGEYLGALLYSCVLVTGNISGSQCDLDEEGMRVFIEAVKDLIKEDVI